MIRDPSLGPRLGSRLGRWLVVEPAVALGGRLHGDDELHVAPEWRETFGGKDSLRNIRPESFQGRIRWDTEQQRNSPWPRPDSAVELNLSRLSIRGLIIELSAAERCVRGAWPGFRAQKRNELGE